MALYAKAHERPGLVELHSGTAIESHEWPAYRKRTATRAKRIDGPFTVRTAEGELDCEDGWLAIDARGYPYPIAADEFELIYEPA
jgi:hypothetical protein